MVSEKMTWSQLVDILGLLLKAFMKRDVEWDCVPNSVAQGILKNDRRVFARQFIMFLANGGRFIMIGLKVLCVSLSPGYYRPGWTFWKGPTTGNGLTGEEERDLVSVNLGQVDLALVELSDGSEFPGEKNFSGEGKIARLKRQRYVLLGSTVSSGIWENYQACQNKSESVLEKWYEQTGVTYVDFLGDVFRNNKGERLAVYFSRLRSGEWKMDYRFLNEIWRMAHVTAVLKPEPVKTAN